MSALMDMLLEQFILDIRKNVEKGSVSDGEINFLLRNSDFIEKRFPDDNLLLSVIKEIKK